MSSYQQEYLRGHEDGYEKGLKEFRTFDDEEATVYYHMTKIFEYLGVDDNKKLINRYKQYVIDECKSFNG